MTIKQLSEKDWLGETKRENDPVKIASWVEMGKRILSPENCWHGTPLEANCDQCTDEQEAQFVAPPREREKK